MEAPELRQRKKKSNNAKGLRMDAERPRFPPSPGPGPMMGGPDNMGLRIFKAITNSLTHILIIFVVVSLLIFSFTRAYPLGATPVHIILCVTGYHLLMAQAILSMSPDNTWSMPLSPVNKRRIHWILQIMGSGLAIAGSFIKIADKTAHWDTYHGQFALVALVFTSVALVNGLASLWAYEVRTIIPPKLSKVTHICIGTVAFAASTVALCYGIDKNNFRNWSTDPLATALIVAAATYTTIIIINPMINFYTKLTT